MPAFDNDKSAEQTPAISARGLVVAYGTRVAVSGLDLDCACGEVLCLLGPNGAGKTSTIETIEGYRRPTSGTVRLLGMDPINEKRQVSKKVGVMLQRGGIYPRMTVKAALNLYAGFYENPIPPAELSKKLDLDHVLEQKYRRLSGGEAQRLSLALAIIGRPEVVFLDEPTAGVDPAGRLVIREIIRTLADSGVAVLLTTHELAEAERVADRISIIYSGKKIAEGTLDELRGAYGTNGVRFNADPFDDQELARRLGRSIIRDNVGGFRVEAEPTPSLLAELTSHLASMEIRYSSLTTLDRGLEEIYLELVGNSEESEPSEAEPTKSSRRKGRGRS